MSDSSPVASRAVGLVVRTVAASCQLAGSPAIGQGRANKLAAYGNRIPVNCAESVSRAVLVPRPRSSASRSSSVR